MPFLPACVACKCTKAHAVHEIVQVCTQYTGNLGFYLSAWEGGLELSNLISELWGGVAEEAICLLWVGSGGGQEEPGMIDYASDWNGPWPVIAHIKDQSTLS